MRYHSPWVLALLLLLPVLAWLWMKSSRQPKIRIPLPLNADSKVRIHSSVISAILKTIGIGFLIVALARPQSVSKFQDRKESGIDIVMVLDVSLSMLIQDMGDSSRMDIAKETFKSFIDGRTNDRIGFVIFSGEPLTLAPPTLDYGLLMAQVNTARPGTHGLRDGTAIGDGMALAINRLKKSTAKSRVIILLTDGDNNVGRIDPITSGDLALGYGIRVYSIAIGTEGRVRQPFPQQTPTGTVYTYAWVENRLNPSLLKQISEKTNGKFYRVTDEKALQEVFRNIDKLEKSEVITKNKVRYQEEFTKPLLFGILILLLERLLSLLIWRQWT
jgi:Ca-activated chloride channel family protein